MYSCDVQLYLSSVVGGFSFFILTDGSNFCVSHLRRISSSRMKAEEREGDGS